MWLALAVWGGMAIESVLLLGRYRLAHPWGEQAANLFILIVGGALRISVRGLFLAGFVAVSALAPVHWADSPVSAVLCFLGVDFIFYAWHRYLHHHPFGFAFHSVHHTGHTFSLSLAGRLPWPLRLVDDFVCLPLLLAGCGLRVSSAKVTSLVNAVYPRSKPGGAGITPSRTSVSNEGSPASAPW